MSHTKVNTTTKNRRGRGRGQGNQQNRNTNSNNNYSTHPANYFEEEYSDNNVGIRNGGGEWKSSNSRGNGSNYRGNGSNRPHNKFKSNNFHTAVPKRSHLSSNTSPRNGNIDRSNDEFFLPVQERNMFSQDSSRLPKHAQNPIFTGELIHRFNSLLPPSELLAPETPLKHSEQAKILFSQSNLENNTFASISNNVSHGFKNHPNRKQKNKNADCGDTGFNSEGNRMRTQNHNRLQDSDDPQTSFRTNTGMDLQPPYSPQSNSMQQSGVIMGSEKKIRTRFSADNENTVDPQSFVKKPPMHLAGNNMNPPSGFSKDNRFRVPDTGRNLQYPVVDNYKIQQNFSADIDRQFQSKHNTKANSHPQSCIVPDNKIPQHGANQNVSKRPIDTSNMEKRKQILIANGFNVPDFEQYTFSPNSGNKISNEEKESSQPNLSSALFSQIESFDRRNNSNKKTPASNSGNSRKPPDNRSTAASLKTREHPSSSIVPTLELPRQIDNYNSFLKQQRGNERELPPQQNSSDGWRENSKPLLSLSESNPLTNYSLGLTDGAVTGMPHFNIQQSARDPGQRVPTRAEALQKIQDEYEMKILEYEAKEKEREAKKREQYLARYSHVDQGHRLAETYLEEATGFAPGYASEEDVRRRQQEQILRDAIAFREREKEKNEKGRKKEENKKQWMKKNKNVDAGYKLGNKDNRGSESGQGLGQKSFPLNTAKVEKKKVTTGNKPAASQQTARTEDLMCPELMLEGETLEEALERQQEQLLLEALLCNDRELKNPEEFQPLKKEKMPPRFVQQRMKEKVQKLPQNPTAPDVSILNTNTGPASPPVSVVKPLQTTQTLDPDSEEAQAMREQLLAQLASLMAKPPKAPAMQEPDNSQKSKQLQTEAAKPSKPVSRVLNNPSQGAVLVLRPTEEALNQALNLHLQLLDQMDKHGDSTLYKPHVEEAPVYSNNRFEYKQSRNTVEVSGAVPKQLVTASPTPAAPTGVSTETEEPVIDRQAEMRAARLRMQQQYEETLRRQREAQENAVGST